jgi:hypothetical protein
MQHNNETWKSGKTHKAIKHDTTMKYGGVMKHKRRRRWGQATTWPSFVEKWEVFL